MPPTLGAPVSVLVPDAKVSEVEKLYFDMVENACSRDLDKLISNSKAAHAVYLIYTLFKNAKRTVNVLTGRLDAVIGEGKRYHAYGDPELCRVADEFVQGGGALRILMADEVSPDDLAKHPFIKNVRGGGGFDIGRLAGRWKAFSPHFIVKDDIAYRFEFDTETHRASANFRDEKLGPELTTLFGTMWEDREPILLPAHAA